MRKTILAGLTAVLIAACGQVPHAGPQAGDQILFIANHDGVTAIDARTNARLTSLPPGVPSSDWKHYYVVSGSLLLDLDPLSGRTSRSLTVPAGFALPIVTASGQPGGLSQDGGWLVLEKHDASGSHLLDIRTTLAAKPVQVDLAGDFTFDAVSNDGMRIYLIQHASGGHYFVRDYVMGAGLDPQIIFDKSDGAAAMSGVRLTGVPSNDGEWLYSVYARENQSAFVHELNLGGSIALCVDLTGPGFAADRGAMRWSLAMSPGGGRLFAVNGPLGIVTELRPPDGPGGVRTVQIGRSDGATSTLLTRDGASLLVGGSGGVRRIELNALHIVNTVLEKWTVTGLASSADGKTVYALSDSGQVAQLDTSGHVITTFDSGVNGAAALAGVQRFS